MRLLKKASDKLSPPVNSNKKDEVAKKENVMILLRAKCPHCGHWISDTISKNILERFVDTPTTDEEKKKQANENRLKRYGRIFGSLLNGANEVIEDRFETFFSITYGTVNALGGISTQGICPFCGAEISLLIFDKGVDEYRVARDRVKAAINENAMSYDTLVELSHFYNEKYEPELTESFNQAYSSMINNFTQIPAHYRRFVYFVDKEIVHLSTDCVTLPFNRIPASIQLYKGLSVQKGTLYVLHPYKPDLYIPYDSLEVALFDEEMSEFLDIMSKLGAKSIQFERYRDHALAEKNSESTKESTEVREYEITVGSKTGNQQKDEAFQKIVDTYRGVKEYDLSPGKLPYVPENLVWLPHRDNWMREIQDRLEGRSRKIDLKVGFQQNELVSTSEKEKLELFIADLDTSVKYGSEREEKHVLREMRSLLWRVEIEFYPLKDYKKKTGFWSFFHK